MSGKKSILVIEDDIQYGEMLKDAIQQFGYETYLAYSATGGLDIIKQKKLDLIITDVSIPGVSGIDLAEKLMNMYLDIPIILLTGNDGFEEIRKALELGISDYLVKPVNINELPLIVEKNIERKSLESQKLQENKAETLLKALKALMRALDAKDKYTSGHSQRVVQLAMLVAEDLELSTDEKYTLQLGAFLHDIGKIGMPDSILKKAEGLEDYELNIARDHPVIGSQIIGEIEELGEVTSVVRHHHERWDGKGYPDGLKGEAIPFFARIIAIIDCYEALVSDRVYRKGVKREEALKIIEKNAGTQFDPELVPVFTRVMRRLFANGKAHNNQKAVTLEFPGGQLFAPLNLM